MASIKESIPHVQRTAADHRQNDMYNATIGRIEQINSRIRLLRLYLDNDQPHLRFLPGQYIDLHIPEIERVGGFTITSPPQTAMRIAAPTPSTTTPPTAATFDDPYIELAIQESPDNPPAAYVWNPPEQIMNAPVRFRIGGNFTLPPMTLSRDEFLSVDNIVLIAGGVGINPIMSMLSAMDMQGADKMGGLPRRVRVLYSSKAEFGPDAKAQEVLFEHRLRAIAERRLQKKDGVDFKYQFYCTTKEVDAMSASIGSNVHVYQRRMTEDDLIQALGPEAGRSKTLVYVCGLPAMTDHFVQFLQTRAGMTEKNVLCEKWW